MSSNATHVSDPLQFEPIGNFIFNLFVCISGSIGNATVLFLFWKDRKILRTSQLYIISMAASDFLQLSIGVPLNSCVRLITTKDSSVCSSIIGFRNSILLCCLLNVVVAVLDRYWSTIHAVHYRNHSNKRIAKSNEVSI